MSNKTLDSQESNYAKKEPSSSPPKSNAWTLDTIIQKIFPILGILMVVGGLGYFFYDGLWGNISTHARLGLGFFFGVALIIGGYSFSEKLKKFADVVIGGGILSLYSTLIYGSRFDFAQTMESAVIPEGFALGVSVLFCSAIAWYSTQRESKTILILGMLGAYLTPFFIGESGSFEYGLSFSSFLLYFIAISISLIIASMRMNLSSLMGINMLGIFVSTLTLSGFVGDGFAQTPVFSLFACLGIIIAHLVFVSVNTAKFHTKKIISSLYFIVPFLWYILVSFGALSGYSFEIWGELSMRGIVFALLAIVYFGLWNYINTKNTLPEPVYNSVYIMGLISLAITFLDISSVFGDFSGVILSGISIIFAYLFYISKKDIREIAFITLSLIGMILTATLFTDINLSSDNQILGIFTKEILLFCLSLFPFTLHFILPKGSLWIHEIRSALGYIGTGTIAFLLITDIIEDINLRWDMLFFTIPSLLLTGFMVIKSSFVKAINILPFALGGIIIGYSQSFIYFLENIFPAHRDTFFASSESLITLISLISCSGLVYWAKKNYSHISSGYQFSIIALTVLVIFQLGSHELIGIYNSFFPYNFDVQNTLTGIRALGISFWWIAISSILMFLGIKNTEKYPLEKQLGMALMVFAFGKIVLYDLSHIDTNLKVLLFVITGILLMGISYFLHSKKKDSNIN